MGSSPACLGGSRPLTHQVCLHVCVSSQPWLHLGSSPCVVRRVNLAAFLEVPLFSLPPVSARGAVGQVGRLASAPCSLCPVLWVPGLEADFSQGAWERSLKENGSANTKGWGQVVCPVTVVRSVREGSSCRCFQHSRFPPINSLKLYLYLFSCTEHLES